MTTVSDGLFQWGGVPVGSGYVAEVGKAWFVKPSTGNDGNSGSSPNAALKTLATALSKATANKDEVVYLIAESNTAGSTTDYQAATLDWNKDGVHLVGVGASPMIGSRARIGQLSTVKTIDTLFKLSANNCYIANLEIFQGVATSTATTPVAMQVTGQRNKIANCQISGIGDTSMDVAGARSLLLTAAAENEIVHCYIGLDTVIRATAAAEVELAGAATRNRFSDCHFESYTSNASMLMVTIAAAMDRFTIFKDCIFNNVLNISSATAMTAALSGAAINGVVLIKDSMFAGFTNITAADNSRVQVLGLNGLATGHLISIAQGVDVT